MALIGNERAMVWFQTEGAGTPFQPFGIADKGVSMSGITIPFAGRSQIYGRDNLGRPILIKQVQEAPGDLPSATIALYETGQIDILSKAAQTGCPIAVQRRVVTCGILNNPNIWDKIWHFGDGNIDSITPSDGPGLEYDGTTLSNEASVSFSYVVQLVQTGLSALSSGETLDLLDIAGIPDEDCNACGNGYQGADKVLIAGVAGDVGGTTEGTVTVSVNGGSSWTQVSAEPFAATATDYEDVTFVDLNLLSPTQVRLIAATGTTVAASKAQVAYADVSLSDMTTTSWTVSTIDGTSVADVVEAMAWLDFDRLYLASAGDIYIDDSQAENIVVAASYTGATAFAGFTQSPDGDTVWAYGASNLILREVGKNGVWETRVGPTGGGAFTALAVAGNDGTIYAGNGTKIFSNTDNAGGTGNWTQLKDFGANKAVVEIQVIGGAKAQGGDSQLLRAIVDDTAGSDGSVWQSLDGGATWSQITVVTNTGYNAAYFGEIDDNYATIVGDGGVIHRLSPQ